MRQLCNLAYAARVEHLDRDELKQHDKELEAAPGEEVHVSRGTTDLMASFSMPRKG